MKRLHFYLTFGLFLGLLLVFGLVRVSIPKAGVFWAQASLDGPFRLFDPKTHQAEYEHLRTYIQAQQKKLGQDFVANDTSRKIHILSEARHFLRQTLFEELVPFWLDTEWDYNGTTEMPRQGTIACGYFVSTLLLHLGFSFDKYRLSQMPSSEMIKQLCHLPSIKTIYKNDFQALLHHLHQQEDGVFFDWAGQTRRPGFQTSFSAPLCARPQTPPRRCD
ncbi:MAG: hypothetical protein HC913_01030 [Microscillaceae bacterium]|nr:hypothetical protein [Microscillaceae bacterium]